MIKQFSSTEQQKGLLARIGEQNQDLVASIRENILLYEDIFALPERLLKSLCEDVDPQVMAKACRNETPEILELISKCLPKAGKEIFDFEIKSERVVEQGEMELAKQTLLHKAHELLTAGILSFQDIKNARKMRAKMQSLKGAA